MVMQPKPRGNSVQKIASNDETIKEPDKETQKRRTFSINASSLIPDRLRRSSRGSFQKTNEKSNILDSSTIASVSTATRSRGGA